MGLFGIREQKQFFSLIHHVAKKVEGEGGSIT